MSKTKRLPNVVSEKQFLVTLFQTGALILFIALVIALTVTWFTTRAFEPKIHYQALRTAFFLPMAIVPICVAVVGLQSYRLHRRIIEVSRLALTDEMTGLANRRAFMEEAVNKLKTTDIEYEGLCVYIIDLDHFKQVNDRYGHDAGDRVLIHAAQLLRKATPRGSLVARLGGEEFAVMMHYQSISEVHERAEAIRHHIASTPCAVEKHMVTITASLGAGIANPRDSISDMLSRADNALYQAKHEGRNRFSIAA